MHSYILVLVPDTVYPFIHSPFPSRNIYRVPINCRTQAVVQNHILSWPYWLYSVVGKVGINQIMPRLSSALLPGSLLSTVILIAGILLDFMTFEWLIFNKLSYSLIFSFICSFNINLLSYASGSKHWTWVISSMKSIIKSSRKIAIKIIKINLRRNAEQTRSIEVTVEICK